MSRLRSEGGYSLIELVTVMALLSTVLAGLVTLFVSGTNSEIDLNRRFQAQQGARVAMDRLRRDIHCGSQAVPNTATPPASSTVLVLADACATGGYASWCTVANGATYDLYRALATTCSSANGTKYASSVVTNNGLVFTYTQQSTSALAHVAVNLQVNTQPSLTQETYKLADDITLRNSARTCLTSTPTQFASPRPPC